MRPGALAWTISTATRLPLISIPLFVAVGVAGSGSALAGTLWAVLCLALTGGFSTAYLEYLRRTVRIGDPVRIAGGGRLRPLRLICAQHIFAWLVLTLAGVPFGPGSLVLAYAILTVLLAAISPEEISLHAAGVCAAAVALAHAFGPWGLAAALLLPAVWWARTVTGRHTDREVALGVLSGALSAMICFLLTGG